MPQQSWPSVPSQKVPTSPPPGTVAVIVPEGSDRVVSVHGEIDAYSAPQLRECLVELVESSQSRVVVDVENMGFIDSHGLGVLAASAKRLRAAGRALALRSPTRQTAKLLEMTGLGLIVAID